MPKHALTAAQRHSSRTAALRGARLPICGSEQRHPASHLGGYDLRMATLSHDDSQPRRTRRRMRRREKLTAKVGPPPPLLMPSARGGERETNLCHFGREARQRGKKRRQSKPRFCECRVESSRRVTDSQAVGSGSQKLQQAGAHRHSRELGGLTSRCQACATGRVAWSRGAAFRPSACRMLSRSGRAFCSFAGLGCLAAMLRNATCRASSSSSVRLV